MKNNKNKKLKILIVVGTRPNLIKVAPLLREFKAYSVIKPVLVHTGQHYDYAMSQAFFNDLKIPTPDYNLAVGSGSHAEQTAMALVKLEKTMIREKPGLVIVIGDVNSSLAAAIAAIKLHIPIAHVEAGPRDFDMKKPEEINRILVDRIADVNFCPTRNSVKNLKKEGIDKNAYFTGDIMLDAFLFLIATAKKKETAILKKYHLIPKNYILLTVHRQENADYPDKLHVILGAAIESGFQVLFPVHPRTKKCLSLAVASLKNHKNFSNLHFVDPLGYIDAIIVEKNAKLIITDSGGIQKEAYWSKVPCGTLMQVTGWPETVENGWNTLVGADKKKIIRFLKTAMRQKHQKKYFGRGDAAEKITNIILKRYADTG